MLKRYWFYIVLFSTLVLQAKAQTTYPIQVNANLLPPYSAYLSDYYSGTREKLTLTLINRDQFKPTLNVRLRMIITAPGGLRLQTNEQAFIEPLIVENGSPVRLTQDDLAPYFQQQNLITQGYMASGKFPEGMVEFCFQAVEAYTGQALSLSTCTRAWITSQKPPLLSLPRNNESIVFREPLNVLFQWTPLHQGLAQVEYEFILKELWDNGMTPQAAFPYAPEIYRETTRSTSLVYGAMQPPLLAGKRYAWCIRAQARDGMDAVNLFQNDGYSEIRWFTLQDNCLPPEFVLATAEKKRLNVEWTALPEHIGFSVSYRVIKARSSDGKVDASEWKEQQSQQPSVILYGLQSGGTYEYRVASYCMAGQPVYSPIFSITLPETDSARLAQCGIMPDVNLTNKEPIKELKTGEIIMANDYPVTVTKISGTNGIYTGEGWTIVPWLNDAKIAVQFTSITVNTDKQMINGYIDAKYDKNEGQIANLDDVFEGGFDVGTVKTGITKVDHIVDFSIPGVEAFSLNDEGELVITDAGGEPHTITPANNEGQGNEGNKVVVFPMTVQDKDGNVYQVEKVLEKDATGKEVEKAKATYVGKVGTPLAEGSFDPSQLNGDKAIVTFAKGDGIYGFDTWLDYYDNVSLIEGKYQKLYTDYYAPWKLVPAGKTDKVQATIVITDKNIKPEQVIFKTPKGTEYKATYENGIYKLQLAAGPAGDVQELYALYPNGKDKYYTLGKLNIVSYELQRQKVVLVPVNNVPVSKDAIQKALQDIYGPVGVTWDVVLDDNFNYTENYRLMEKSTGLSTYNEDMRALNDAYKSARADKFDKAANYLFFLKATGSEQVNDRDATGFMPRGSQFGYIFTSEIKDANEAVTVAHELGHGRWKLFHTFDEHYGGYKKGETENVMDYNNGLHVAKWQWDIMNDPAMLVNVFEGDGDSEYSRAVHFAITPSGNLVDEFYVKEGGKDKQIPVTALVANDTKDHTISSIKYNDIVYTWDVSEKVFKGGSGVIYTKKDSKLPPKVNLFKNIGDGCNYYYTVVDWTAADEKTTDLQKTVASKLGTSSRWIVYPFSVSDPSCKEDFIKDIKRRNVQCDQEEIESGDALLKEYITSTDPELITNVVNTVCLSSLQKLSYTELSGFFSTLAKQKTIGEWSEVALLRLMNALKTEDYKSFYTLLEENSNAILINLVKELDDHSIYFWVDGSNYTNFNGALVTMFRNNPAAFIEKLAEVGNEKLLGQVFNLDSKPFVSDQKIEGIPVLIEMNEFRFGGKYNEKTGEVAVVREHKVLPVSTGTVRGGGGGFTLPMWTADDLPVTTLSPLSPIVITTADELPLVQTALGEGSSDVGTMYIVPAIFLKFRGGKIFEDEMQKTGMVALDVVTIASSGGAMLATKVTWARRLWALTEVAGAVGNIAVNTGAVSPDSKLYKAVEIYNGVMLVIGVKAAGKGLISFTRGLTDQTKNLLKNSSSFKSIILARYMQWRVAIRNLDKLSDAEKQLVTEQEQVWKLLGVTDEMADALKATVVSKLEGYSNLKNWVVKNLDDVNDAELLSKLENLASDQSALTEFNKDILTGNFASALKGKPELIDSWKVLKDANISDVVRQNPANLEGLSKALKQNGYNADYFENLLKSKADLQKFIDNYVSKIGNDGKFVDNALEADYTSYVSRKAKEGKPPRDRADWNEASDYMKYDSPTARGNNFNRKAWDEKWYDYWEVYLDNGKYLDGYDPIGKLIVSRKATDLADISEATFVKHLDELLEKYAPPRIIKSKKPGYEKLYDKPLPKDAILVLEIPESNRTFYDIDRYTQIAKNKGITIKFRSE
jgi:hypothetical protein